MTRRRLNTANRAFAHLVVAWTLAYALVLACAAVLTATLAVDAVRHLSDLAGWVAANDLRPAVLFIGLVVAGAVSASRSARRQASATHALGKRVRSLRTPAPPAALAAAARTRLGRRVVVVDAAEPFSFAYGLAWPRVVVSTGLLESVSPEELEAVLEHERYHVRNLDPLKVLLARILPSALFFLPALRGLRRRYVAGRELAADRRAAAISGRAALAGALYKVAAGPAWSELGAAAAIGGTDVLEARVEQLESGREPEVPGVGIVHWLLTVAGAALLVWSFSAALGDVQAPLRWSWPVPPVAALPACAVCFAIWRRLRT